MPTTITAGVSTYSMFSASPVTYAPQGPIAERANEYAPPVWGRAGDISAMEKQRPRYITVISTVAIGRPPNPPAREAEVPAEEVAADDGADAQGPEGPDPGVALQAALLEVAVRGVFVADAAVLGRLFRHRGEDSGGRSAGLVPSLGGVGGPSRGRRRWSAGSPSC